jgi:hypothetical protein
VVGRYADRINSIVVFGSNRQFECVDKVFLMDSETRVAVAYIAGRLVNQDNSTYIFDYARNSYINLVGTVTPELVHVYDYARLSLISGTSNFLYDFGKRIRLLLHTTDTLFNGYDYGSGSVFHGRVLGPHIELFDFGECRACKFRLRRWPPVGSAKPTQIIPAIPAMPAIKPMPLLSRTLAYIARNR